MSDENIAARMLSVWGHDYTTYEHCVRTAMIVICFIRRVLGCNHGHDLEEVCSAMCMHDIGKIKTPTRILIKPGKLTDAEMEVIKKHPTDGVEILRQTCRLSGPWAVIVGQHHEDWIGSGYSEGLIGDKIHVLARIAKIVDVFDALTSERPYKKAMKPGKALSIMVNNMIDQFDRVMLREFIRMFEMENQVVV